MTDAARATTEARPTVATAEVLLTPAELELVRTSLRLLRSTLGREEADELEEIKALLAKLGG